VGAKKEYSAGNKQPVDQIVPSLRSGCAVSSGLAPPDRPHIKHTLRSLRLHRHFFSVICSCLPPSSLHFLAGLPVRADCAPRFRTLQHSAAIAAPPVIDNPSIPSIAYSTCLWPVTITVLLYHYVTTAITLLFLLLKTHCPLALAVTLSKPASVNLIWFHNCLCSNEVFIQNQKILQILFGLL
jgi:hypothetical protein